VAVSRPTSDNTGDAVWPSLVLFSGFYGRDRIAPYWLCSNIRCNAMRENAQPATPTIADRQVPASSSHRTQAPVPLSFASAIGDTPEGVMFATSNRTLSGDLGNAALPEHFGDVTLPDAIGVISTHAAKAASFSVFKIAGNGEPVLLEGTPTLDAAVARVVGLREWFPVEYLIVSQATGKRIVFTQHG